MKDIKNGGHIYMWDKEKKLIKQDLNNTNGFDATIDYSQVFSTEEMSEPHFFEFMAVKKNSEYLELKKHNISIDEMLREFINSNSNNYRLYCNFFGHKYYSDNTTYDTVYLDYYGLTKDDYDYYKKNKNEIVLNIASSIDFLVDNKNKFKLFKFIMKIKNSTSMLVCYDIAINLVNSFIINNPDYELILRYRNLKQDQKEYVREIINKNLKKDFLNRSLKYLKLIDRNEIDYDSNLDLTYVLLFNIDFENFNFQIRYNSKSEFEIFIDNIPIIIIKNDVAIINNAMYNSKKSIIICNDAINYFVSKSNKFSVKFKDNLHKIYQLKKFLLDIYEDKIQNLTDEKNNHLFSK